MDRINSLGLLKDIKNGEYRVVLTPAEVAALSDDGIRDRQLDPAPPATKTQSDNIYPELR